MITLKCPQCEQPIAADQINVQEMVAVCSACNTVFRFNVPEQLQKRRKVQQPERLHVTETDDLEISYRRILGRGAKSSAIGMSFAGAMFVFISVMMLGGILAGDIPVVVALLPLMLLSVFGYAVALLLFTETHITVADGQLSVTRRPLPILFAENPSLDLGSIVQIGCEETEASRKAGSVNQDYMVFAELVDGNRVSIAKELPRDYAFYIAQMLDESLPAVEDLDDIIHNLGETDLVDSDDTFTVLSDDDADQLMG